MWWNYGGQCSNEPSVHVSNVYIVMTEGKVLWVTYSIEAMYNINIVPV